MNRRSCRRLRGIVAAGNSLQTTATVRCFCRRRCCCASVRMSY